MEEPTREIIDELAKQGAHGVHRYLRSFEMQRRDYVAIDYGNIEKKLP